MLKVGDYGSVATFFVAPDLSAILPDILGCCKSILCVRYCIVIQSVISFHERAARALPIGVELVIWVITDVNFIVLKVLVNIAVLARIEPFIQILHNHDAMLKQRLSKVELESQPIVQRP